MVYISNYTGRQLDSIVSQAENIYNAAVLSLALQYGYTTSTINNPEFRKVLLDQNDNVIAGLRVDDSVFVAELA